MSTRTTVTLDDDIIARLQELSRSTGTPFKTTLNEVIRNGLSAMQTSRRREKVTIPSVNMGNYSLPNLDNIGDVIEHLEGENWR